MKRLWITVLAGMTLSVATLPTPASGGYRGTVTDADEAAQTLAIRDVRTQGDVVSGVLANRSSKTVRDVGLLIRHTWFWNNEHHPGTDNPGRATLVTVTEPIEPGGSVPFTYRTAEPLPIRTDGYFGTTIEVVTFTEAGRSPEVRR